MLARIAIIAAILGVSALAAGEVVDPGPDAPLRVVVFYSPGCAECERAKDAVREMERRYGERVRVEMVNIDRPEDYARLIPYEEHYSSDENATLKVFVGDAYLAGADDAVERLDRVVREQLEKGATTFRPAQGTSQGEANPSEAEDALPSPIKKRFASFSVLAVAAAGLIDGVNPCAFTTIVFLLSMLAYLGKDRRQLAAAGLGFVSATFLTYLLLGLGLLGAVKVFSVQHGLARGLVYAVAGLTFLLAAWSFVDFLRYVRTRDTRKVTLGLPDSIRNRIHKVIREGLTGRRLVLAAAAVGVAVSLLESVCTGQVYLPTIVFVARSDQLRGQALAYLVLYNLMFILPLVAVFAIAYAGVKSQRLGSFLRDYLGAFKLAMALLFVLLGVLVLTTA